MSECVRIFFEENAHKGIVYKKISESLHAEVVGENLIKLRDPSSNSENYFTNEVNYLEVDFQVKTKFLSKLIRNFLDGYTCHVKDCEDDEDAPGDLPSEFFNTA